MRIRITYDESALYTIGVVSELTGLHQQTIRSYEKRGLIKPHRTNGGTRLYSESDIEHIEQIFELSNSGVSLNGIRIILDLENELNVKDETILMLTRRISRLKSLLVANHEPNSSDKNIDQNATSIVLYNDNGTSLLRLH